MLMIVHLLGSYVADLFKSRHRLKVENLFLRHQLNIALRRAPKHLRLRGSDRALLVWMTRFWPCLLGLARIVQPDTIDGTILGLDEFDSPVFDSRALDLAVLSACETAVTNPRAKGNETEALATIMQKRGASAVMASLWQVADVSTAALMARFYKYWRVDGKSKAEALQLAQIDLSRTSAPCRDIVG